MKKNLIASLLLAAFALPVAAQTAAPAAPEAAPEAVPEAAPAPALTANVGVFTSYRFRGIDQTFGKPALQGGIDYNHESGFYVGNWNSNVNSGAGFPDGNLEMDFYGGYKHAFGDFGLDVGAIYYYYPGSEGAPLGTGARSGAVNNQEIYIGGSWKFLSLKYNYAVSDYFSLRGVNSAGASTNQGTNGTGYLDFSGNYDLGEGWGINGHIGSLTLKNVSNGNYTDWKLGVTKDLSGWVIGLAYVGTNAKGNCGTTSSYQPYCFTNSNSVSNTGGLTTGSKNEDAGKGTAVLSVSRTF